MALKELKLALISSTQQYDLLLQELSIRVRQRGKQCSLFVISLSKFL